MDDAINIYSQTVLKRLAGTALSATMLTFFNLIDGTFVAKVDIYEELKPMSSGPNSKRSWFY